MMARMKWETVADQIVEEFQQAHHNVSLLFADLPECETDLEQEYFDDFLEDEARVFCRAVEQEIRDQFGLYWTLVQTGRSGATIVPDCLVGSGHSYALARDEISFFNRQLYFGAGWTGEALQDYNGDYKILLALRHLNMRADQEIRRDWHQWWAREVENAGLNFGED